MSFYFLVCFNIGISHLINCMYFNSIILQMKTKNPMAKLNLQFDYLQEHFSSSSLQSEMWKLLPNLVIESTVHDISAGKSLASWFDVASQFQIIYVPVLFKVGVEVAWFTFPFLKCKC